MKLDPESINIVWDFLKHQFPTYEIHEVSFSRNTKTYGLSCIIIKKNFVDKGVRTWAYLDLPEEWLTGRFLEEFKNKVVGNLINHFDKTITRH
ncbi:hypothetical protein VPH184E373B_0255 [Vibrio phage 184E37-3b]|nr:hypothetical protein MYOV056v2_p0227 [Vibrio phage 184E37.3a]QZI90077.1 hypothetical protein MYOV057v1_p0162 [Vibrio phage 184E37.1]